MPSLKRSWKKYLLLTIAGIAATFVFRNNFNREFFGPVFLSDLFFNISMCFLVRGIIGIVANMDMFSSLIYGTKCLVKLICGRQVSGESMREGYIEYLNSRPRNNDLAPLLFAAIFFTMSLGVALIAG
ncbi:MAG: DUF3899 domain-containing protein [Clostridiales bacterium]|nr:DUF3899 domain-containing protein [Clostridiales bacterium]